RAFVHRALDDGSQAIDLFPPIHGRLVQKDLAKLSKGLHRVTSRAKRAIHAGSAPVENSIVPPPAKTRRAETATAASVRSTRSSTTARAKAFDFVAFRFIARRP